MIFTQLHYFTCSNMLKTILQRVGEISKNKFGATEIKPLLL